MEMNKGRGGDKMKKILLAIILAFVSVVWHIPKILYAQKSIIFQKLLMTTLLCLMEHGGPLHMIL